MRNRWPILSLLFVAGCYYHGEYPNADRDDHHPIYRETRVETYDQGDRQAESYDHRDPVTVYESSPNPYYEQASPTVVYQETVYEPVYVPQPVYINPYYNDNGHYPYPRHDVNIQHDRDRDNRDTRQDQVVRDNRSSDSNDRVRNRDQQKKLTDAVEVQEDRRRERQQEIDRANNSTGDRDRVNADRQRSVQRAEEKRPEVKRAEESKPVERRKDPNVQPIQPAAPKVVKKTDPDEAAPRRSAEAEKPAEKPKASESKRPSAGKSSDEDASRVRRR